MEKLIFFLSELFIMTNIPIACYTKERNIVYGNSIKKDSKLYSILISKNMKDAKPMVFLIKNTYFGCYLGNYTDLIIFGAIQTNELKILYSTLSLLYFYDTGEELDKSNIELMCLDDNQLLELKFLDELDSYKEEQIIRYTLEDERRFMESIQNGDVEKKLTDFAQNMTSQFHMNNKNYFEQYYGKGKVGLLAKSPFKQIEYIAVSTITLATRAAINGGMDVMTAYSLSDHFLQRLENCSTKEDIYLLLPQIQVEFALKVKEHQAKKSSSTHVEKCKVYISRHKNKKFTIDDIVENVGISKAHLSKLFLQEEGSTIHQYTLNLRTEMGANLLKNTEESISVISEYLCFNSQSHFGKVFKEKYGITPQKYRTENKVFDYF